MKVALQQNGWKGIKAADACYYLQNTIGQELPKHHTIRPPERATCTTYSQAELNAYKARQFAKERAKQRKEKKWKERQQQQETPARKRPYFTLLTGPQRKAKRHEYARYFLRMKREIKEMEFRRETENTELDRVIKYHKETDEFLEVNHPELWLNADRIFCEIKQIKSQQDRIEKIDRKINTMRAELDGARAGYREMYHI